MKPELRRLGTSQSPVVIVDDITGAPGEIVALAAAMAPLPPSAQTYYPGLRRIVTEADADAWSYVARLLEAAAPYIGGGFGATGFDLVEASFSMVTAAPDSLSPRQRVPHFDNTDPNHLAILHYLGGTAESGTAFYRQRSTGFEEITDANLDAFVWAAQRESAGLDGYIHGSNDFFEQIGAVEGVPDRLVVYRGCLLHSGIIPPGMAFSEDPRRGRLTANLFIRIRQE